MPCANRTLPALPVNKPSTPTKMVTVACCLYVCCVAQSQPDDDAHVEMTAASPVNIYTHNPDSPQHQQPAGSGTTPPHSPLAAGEASPRHGHHEGHAGIITSATAATPQPVQQVTPPLVSRPGTSHGRGHSRGDAGQRATSASSSRPGTAQRQRIHSDSSVSSRPSTRHRSRTRSESRPGSHAGSSHRADTRPPRSATDTQRTRTPLTAYNDNGGNSLDRQHGRSSAAKRHRTPTPPTTVSDVLRGFTPDPGPLSPPQQMGAGDREKTFTFDSPGRDLVVSPEAVNAAKAAIELVASLSPQPAHPRPPSTDPPPRLTRVERARLEALAAFGGLSFDDMASTARMPHKNLKSKRVMTMKDWESKR